MKNNKLKTSMLVLAFGMAMGASSSAVAAWWPTAQQCVEMKEACNADDDIDACNDWFSYYSYCRRIME